jgi:hypothetical protein
VRSMVPATPEISGTVIRRSGALMDQSLSSLAQKSGANHPTRPGSGTRRQGLLRGNSTPSGPTRAMA